jgi:site-specific DNA-methyltransferase (adenine-specific)
MSQYPDKYFNLAIVDPPYGIERWKRKDDHWEGRSFNVSPEKWNNKKPDQGYFNELFRVSDYRIIWGGFNFTLPNSEYFIVWDKEQVVPNFAECELAWTNCKVPAKIFRHRWFGFHKESEKGIQNICPVQKPVALYKWLLYRYAKPGWRILDTHLGSGSSAVACYEMGFQLIASEIDADYYEAAVERLRLFASQGTLNLENNLIDGKKREEETLRLEA